mmetsp:Transcript_25574/g.101967  ORF Transcript_25574/g.101967 Transcript_25574/m.101967 type:complete len:279 (-) Transcript_25574:64-900(-)
MLRSPSRTCETCSSSLKSSSSHGLSRVATARHCWRRSYVRCDATTRRTRRSSALAPVVEYSTVAARVVRGFRSASRGAGGMPTVRRSAKGHFDKMATPSSTHPGGAEPPDWRPSSPRRFPGTYATWGSVSTSAASSRAQLLAEPPRTSWQATTSGSRRRRMAASASFRRGHVSAAGCQRLRETTRASPGVFFGTSPPPVGDPLSSHTAFAAKAAAAEASPVLMARWRRSSRSARSTRDRSNASASSDRRLGMRSSSGDGASSTATTGICLTAPRGSSS